jgi:hypothetical protein
MGGSPAEIATSEPWTSLDDVAHLGVVKDSIYRGSSIVACRAQD